MEFGLFAGVMLVIFIAGAIALCKPKGIPNPEVMAKNEPEVQAKPKVMTVGERLKKGWEAYYLDAEGLPMKVYKDYTYSNNSNTYTYEKKRATWSGVVLYTSTRLDERDPIFNLPEFKPLVGVSRLVSTYDHGTYKVMDSISVTITASNKKVYRLKFQPETVTRSLNYSHRLPDRAGVESVVECDRFQLHESSFLNKLQELRGIILKPENVLEIKYTITERPSKVTETRVVYGEEG